MRMEVAERGITKLDDRATAAFASGAWLRNVA